MHIQDKKICLIMKEELETFFLNRLTCWTRFLKFWRHANWAHYFVSDPTSLCYYSWMLHVKKRSRKQSWSILFDPAGDQTQKLKLLRWGTNLWFWARRNLFLYFFINFNKNAQNIFDIETYYQQFKQNKFLSLNRVPIL